jgi:hypothetical protein
MRRPSATCSPRSSVSASKVVRRRLSAVTEPFVLY